MAEKRTATTERAPERKTRIPVSGNRNVLTISNIDPAYKYRWVNDTEARLERFKLAGYEFVTHDATIGERKVDSSDGVGSLLTKEVGKGITAYAMRIKREWYEEDKAAKQAEVDKSEEAMKRQMNSKDDGGYGNVTINGK